MLCPAGDKLKPATLTVVWTELINACCCWHPLYLGAAFIVVAIIYYIYKPYSMASFVTTSESLATPFLPSCVFYMEGWVPHL